MDNESVRRVFEDIARGEKTHVEELMVLLNKLDPEQARKLRRGAEEAAKLSAERRSPAQTSAGQREAARQAAHGR
ncbi:MAG: hypothetical protein ABWW70_05965 [Thermoproteota archaeon]